MIPFMSPGNGTAGTLGFVVISRFAAVASMTMLSRSTIPTKGSPFVLNVPSLKGSATAGGATSLDVDASEAAVFEDALAGVAAGRAGGFGFVVGVDRGGQAEALHEHGADIVVEDLAELLT